MSLRIPLIQTMLVIVGLLVGSFLPIPILNVVIPEVRLLLVMELGVAMLYTGLLLRRQPAQAPLHVADDEPLHAQQRGY